MDTPNGVQEWSEELAITVIEAKGQYFLGLTNDNMIWSFKNVKAGVRFFEDMYNRKHDQGYEASMSATLNYLSFQPSVLNAPPKEELKEGLANERVVRVSNVAGSFNGCLLKDEIGKAWWDKGIKPRLISKGGQ